MKKALSILLSLALLLTSAFACITAYAKEKTLSAQLEEKIKASAEYLVKDSDAFGVDSSADFLLYLKADALTDEQKNAFVDDVRANLKANGGKIIGTYGENLGAYASIIQALNIMDYDVEDFDGANLVALMEAMDVHSACNPYYYRLVAEVAGEEFGTALCDMFIADYYTLGKGMDYYGFSCDNTCHFLTTIANFSDSYEDYIEDAKRIIKHHTVDEGCYFNADFGTDANADSTAMAVMAYSSLGNIKKAYEYYSMLIANFESKTGIFTYAGDDSAYSTKDALIALEYFKELVDAEGFDYPENNLETTEPIEVTIEPIDILSPSIVITEPATEKESTTEKETTTEKANDKLSPDTGSYDYSVVFVALAIGGAVILVVTRKKARV